MRNNQAILDARAAHKGASLADLYDPLTMPEGLRKAHDALDKAVDALYGKKPFTSDAERVAFLFARYEKLTQAPLEKVATKPARKTREQRSKAKKENN